MSSVWVGVEEVQYVAMQAIAMLMQ